MDSVFGNTLSSDVAYYSFQENFFGKTDDNRMKVNLDNLSLTLTDEHFFSQIYFSDNGLEGKILKGSIEIVLEGNQKFSGPLTKGSVHILYDEGSLIKYMHYEMEFLIQGELLRLRGDKYLYRKPRNPLILLRILDETTRLYAKIEWKKRFYDLELKVNASGLLQMLLTSSIEVDPGHNSIFALLRFLRKFGYTLIKWYF